jgi:hypothetical protein
MCVCFHPTVVEGISRDLRGHNSNQSECSYPDCQCTEFRELIIGNTDAAAISNIMHATDVAKRKAIESGIIKP